MKPDCPGGITFSPRIGFPSSSACMYVLRFSDGAFPNAETPAADAAGNRVRLYVTSDAASLVAPAASLLAARGLELGAVKLGSPTLEDVFIHLTGRTLR